MPERVCHHCKLWSVDAKSLSEGECMSAKLVYGTTTPRDGLAYLDRDHHTAYLFTGPDFGCIHWEERKDG